jgi:WD40 repeat protein
VNLYGPVRAGENVGTGDATVKLSLDWKGTVSTTHTLRVLNASGGESLPVSSRLLRSLPHPDRLANVLGVRFTPKGSLFVAGYPSGVVQIWDVASGKELRRIDSPRGYRGSADYAFTPTDFSTLYVPIDGRKVHRTPSDPRKPFTIEFDGQVLVWDLATGKSRPALKPQRGRGVEDAKISPDGKRLVTVERAGNTADSEPPPDKIRMYDTASDRSWDLGEGYGQVAFSPDGRRIYLTRTAPQGNNGASLVVFDREGKQLAALCRVKGSGFAWPTVSADGKRLVVCESKGVINQPGTLRVFDLATEKEIAAFPSGGDFPFLVPSFSPDGRLLAASDYDGQVTIWDVEKKAVVRKQRFVRKGMGRGLAFSPDGTRLAVPARVKTEDERARHSDPLDLPQPRVYLFDLTGDAPPEEIVCPHGWAGGVAFSADGKILAAGGAGAVHLFDVMRRSK